MPTNLYNEARVAFAKKLLDWEVDDFQMYLLRDTYVFDAGHALANIPAAAILAGPQPVASRSVDANGWCVGDDVVFVGVPYTGFTVNAAMIYSPTNPYAVWYSSDLNGMPFQSISGTYAVRLTNAEQAYFRL